MEREDVRRIMEMVESGRISAAEGARLMDSFEERSSPSANNRICPFCAESIPVESVHCPECRSPLTAAAPASECGTDFQSLPGIGKFLVIYTLLVSGFALISNFSSFGPSGIAGSLLSALGLAAGILILKGRTTGWSLGVLWAALQVISVVIHGEVINEQVFRFGILTQVNGQGIGVNVIGILLLILFMKARR